MFNLHHAYQIFNEYLQVFDKENDKIKLKIIHTEGVIRCAREISRRMGLSEEDCALAELIALLHDIGRFEQIRRFDSFERSKMDHAAYGVDLLFGQTEEDEPYIRKFIDEDCFDDIIRIAIAKHSLYELDPIEDERALLHARLIRDADKLDNCRVKLEERLVVLLQKSPEEVGMETISDKVWNYCLNQKSVISEDRVTKMDYWISYIAYFYDINFRATFSIIEEEDYAGRIIRRIPYGNSDTQEKMQKLQQMLTEYIHAHA